ncbi:branched-chain amino acid ABC transporter permease [Hylemonella gracilis]|uniref:Inner-membrane translocator n=1 Tax=Hylemonella gracilis ATCC 19624 TaxID=887062 RepID=F3KV73_9BURK|nr:branched-chain amino acid ABC transporter permease [Hylemonella gracilis]EGI76296.1 inner-membrane translocator [Hylemonella gracilis ATCC 19624]
MNAASSLHEYQRWKRWEPLFWLLALASPWYLSGHALLINEVAIVALFALSLDLVMGYAGVVSLGHAAFFGMGAYAAALFAKHINPDPVMGLFFGIAVSTVLGALASLSIMRGTSLTLLMVTMGVALILMELANKLDWLTGGADGLQGVIMGPVHVPFVGRFEFDLYGQVAAWYSLAVLFVFFLLSRRFVQSPLGGTLMALRDNRLRAMAIGIPVTARLALIYTIAAGVAGAAGALLAQTTSFASVEVFAFDRSADLVLLVVIGGAGWLYGGVIGAAIFKVLQDWISSITPQYWTFWIGLFLVVLMMVGRERVIRPWTWASRGKKK